MSTYEELLTSGRVRIVDGWHIHAFYVPYFEVAQQRPPRVFGVIDQLVFELSRPSTARAAWLLAIGSAAYGALDGQVVLVAFGLGFAAYLLFMAYRMSREWQSLPLVACRLAHVNWAVRKQEHGLPQGAFDIRFSFHGRSMASEVAADSLEYLRAKGHVHFEALLLVRERRNDGLCLAVRAADGTAPAVGLTSMRSHPRPDMSSRPILPC